jgi:hypothetical protein
VTLLKPGMNPVGTGHRAPVPVQRVGVVGGRRLYPRVPLVGTELLGKLLGVLVGGCVPPCAACSMSDCWRVLAAGATDTATCGRW